MSAKTLQRVKNFVKSFLGDEHLEAFGYGLPAPPSRPRLKAGEKEGGPVAPDAAPPAPVEPVS